MLRLLPSLLLCLLTACSTDDATDQSSTSSFDREAMLAGWADNFILPAYADFTAEAARLDAAAGRYGSEPSAETLAQLRLNFEEAYLAWQGLSPFMTGPGETYRLREQFNIYPTDTARLAAQDRTDLELPSNIDIQGFPALDYLLYGTRDPAPYAGSIRRLTARMLSLSSAAHADWVNGYRDTYVAASGNSATASVDRTVNDYIFYYEKYLRAGKVGIPAGVFAGQPLPGVAEAPYHGSLSKRLFLEALAATSRFFSAENSLGTYLDALEVSRDGTLLSRRITDGFAAARARAETLNADLSTQVDTENGAMLQLYDALQATVILLKVDMLQALGINVDFVDADGD